MNKSQPALLFSLLSVFILAPTLGFAQFSFELVNSKAYPTRPSTCADSLVLYPKQFGVTDVWGYVDAKGREYAVITAQQEVVIVSLPNLVEVGRVPAPQGGIGCSAHQRLARFWQRHLYVTNDGRGVNEGMMIIDLKGLDEEPQSIHFVKSYAPSPNHITNHTFDIDTLQGYAYITSQTTDGFRIVDIRDAENPKEVTEINIGSIHDMKILPGTNLLYVAGGDQSYSIYDVTDKAKPVRKARFGLPEIKYAHNIWPTDDGRFAATTDESPGRPVLIWDLDKDNGYANPKVVSQYLGANQLAHNVLIAGNFLFVAHYSFGVVALDITSRSSPKVLAHYDTYPDNDQPGYWGSFGVWISPKGYVVTGSMDQGLIQILQFKGPQLAIQQGAIQGLKKNHTKKSDFIFNSAPAQFLFNPHFQRQDNKANQLRLWRDGLGRLSGY